MSETEKLTSKLIYFIDGGLNIAGKELATALELPEIKDELSETGEPIRDCTIKEFFNMIRPEREEQDEEENE